MLDSVRQLFVDIYDSMMEPSSSQSGIDHHPCTPMAGYESGTPDWHNNFGTAADFQVPAEADAAFQSWDWSTWSSGTDSY